MKKNQELKIIFLGTPEFGAIVLEGLVKNDYKPVLVITAPDKPVGRKKILTPPQVKIIAEKHNIPVEQPLKIQNSKIKIQKLKPDLLLSAAYGQIIPENILKIPKCGSLNVHPSLLPKYRGASPIQTAILNGNKETGVTLYLMDEKIDHGNIVFSIKYQISKNTYYQELTKELAKLSVKLIIETIPKWIKGKIKPIPQNELKASYTKIIKKENGEIIWKKSADEIERQIRAFHVWPGSFTFWSGLCLKILKADAIKDNSNYLPGEVFLSNDKLLIKCGENSLEIKELQMEGKKPMGSEEFLRGHSDFIGNIFPL